MNFNGDPKGSPFNYYTKVVECSKECSNFTKSENRNFIGYADTKKSITTFPKIFACNMGGNEGGSMEFPIHIVVIVVIVYSYYLAKVLKKLIYHFFCYMRNFEKLIKTLNITMSAIEKRTTLGLLHIYSFDTKVSNLGEGDYH